MECVASLFAFYTKINLTMKNGMSLLVLLSTLENQFIQAMETVCFSVSVQNDIP